MANESKLAVRGPLTLLGIVAGLLAGGAILPDCSFSHAQAAQLHVVLPLAMPFALWLVFTFTRRHLEPGPFAPRFRWLLWTAADLLLAEALFLLIAAVTYEPGKWLDSFAVGW